MSFIDKIEQASGSIVAAAVATVGGAVVWLIRRIFTNQKQIEMLQREIEVRDMRRDEDRHAFSDLRDEVSEMRKEIREIFLRRG